MLRYTALQIGKRGLRTYKNTAYDMVVPRDVQAFLQGYPDNNEFNETPRIHPNLDFYSNIAKCRPDGLLIEELLNRFVSWFLCTG